MSDYRRTILSCKSITSPALTALNTDCENVALAAPSVTGAASVNFDKANGAANTIFALVYGTISGINFLTLPPYGLSAKIYWLIDIPTITNLAYSMVRLGSDASNYFEWRFADSSHVAGKFVIASAYLGECYVTGTPTLESPTYLQFGAAFDGETNALADMLMDGIWIDVS